MDESSEVADRSYCHVFSLSFPWEEIFDLHAEFIGLFNCSIFCSDSKYRERFHGSYVEAYDILFPRRWCDSVQKDSLRVEQNLISQSKDDNRWTAIHGTQDSNEFALAYIDHLAMSIKAILSELSQYDCSLLETLWLRIEFMRLLFLPFAARDAKVISKLSSLHGVCLCVELVEYYRCNKRLFSEDFHFSSNPSMTLWNHTFPKTKSKSSVSVKAIACSENLAFYPALLHTCVLLQSYWGNFLLLNNIVEFCIDSVSYTSHMEHVLPDFDLLETVRDDMVNHLVTEPIDDDKLCLRRAGNPLSSSKANHVMYAPILKMLATFQMCQPPGSGLLDFGSLHYRYINIAMSALRMFGESPLKMRKDPECPIPVYFPFAYVDGKVWLDLPRIYWTGNFSIMLKIESSYFEQPRNLNVPMALSEVFQKCLRLGFSNILVYGSPIGIFKRKGLVESLHNIGFVVIDSERDYSHCLEMASSTSPLICTDILVFSRIRSAAVLKFMYNSDLQSSGKMNYVYNDGEEHFVLSVHVNASSVSVGTCTYDKEWVLLDCNPFNSKNNLIEADIIDFIETYSGVRLMYLNDFQEHYIINCGRSRVCSCHRTSVQISYQGLAYFITTVFNQLHHRNALISWVFNHIHFYHLVDVVFIMTLSRENRAILETIPDLFRVLRAIFRRGNPIERCLALCCLKNLSKEFKDSVADAIALDAANCFENTPFNLLNCESMFSSFVDKQFMDTIRNESLTKAIDPSFYSVEYISFKMSNIEEIMRLCWIDPTTFAHWNISFLLQTLSSCALSAKGQVLITPIVTPGLDRILSNYKHLNEGILLDACNLARHLAQHRDTKEIIATSGILTYLFEILNGGSRVPKIQCRAAHGIANMVQYTSIGQHYFTVRNFRGLIALLSSSDGLDVAVAGLAICRLISASTFPPVKAEFVQLLAQVNFCTDIIIPLLLVVTQYGDGFEICSPCDSSPLLFITIGFGLACHFCQEFINQATSISSDAQHVIGIENMWKVLQSSEHMALWTELDEKKWCQSGLERFLEIRRLQLLEELNSGNDNNTNKVSKKKKVKQKKKKGATVALETKGIEIGGLDAKPDAAPAVTSKTADISKRKESDDCDKLDNEKSMNDIEKTNQAVTDGNCSIIDNSDTKVKRSSSISAIGGTIIDREIHNIHDTVAETKDKKLITLQDKSATKKKKKHVNVKNSGGKALSGDSDINSTSDNDDSDRLIVEVEGYRRQIDVMNIEISNLKQQLTVKTRSYEAECNRLKQELAANVASINSLQEDVRRLEEICMCQICFERQSNTLFMPCSHQRYCSECMFDITRRSENSSPLCPTCRSPIVAQITCRFK